MTGTDEQVRTLAARYGATVKKSLRGGAVLEVTAGQLDALSQDPDVDHLSGDVPVQRGWAVTTEATGADQVWAERSRVCAASPAAASASRSSTPASARITSALQQARRRQRRLHRRQKRGRRSTSTATARTSPGIIAGGGDGEYPGVAPGAHIVSLRVLGADGSGDTSDVIDAIDWAIEHRGAVQHPRSSTCRSGTRCSSRIATIRCARPCSARSTRACSSWRRRAISARPTDGRPIVGGIISPGNSPAALTVGALNTQGDGAAVRRRDGDLQLARARR